MTANKPGGDTSYEWTTPDGQKVLPYRGRYWAYSKEKMRQMEAAGLIYYRKTGMPMLKHYLDEMPGVPLQTFWDDIQPVISGSSERVGFPTQKPVPLLERIIKSSSNHGDIVLDAFCGCGTAIAAAERLGRRWVGIDVSPTACRVMRDRLESECKLLEGSDFVVKDLPRGEEELRAMPFGEFQDWAVIAIGGIPNKRKTGDKGIDGRVYPVDAVPSHVRPTDGLNFMDVWHPVQVKQRDRVDRPDIDAFESAMQREGQALGFFVGFGFTYGAEREIAAFRKRTGIIIVQLTVKQILEGDIVAKLA